MIAVEQVYKSFGKVRAVRGVSFALEPGQIVGLLGPNGAGKTTTIRMITGYTAPDKGRCTIQGLDVVDNPLAARRRLGYLPESAPLYDEMKVTEYLAFRARLFGLDRSTRKKAVGHVLERCWLTDVKRRRVSKLSKGYKQRVGLASALLHNPPVVILDEPTNGLDPSQVKETRSLIRELAKNKTMLISTHILSEVERMCDRVLIVAAGQLRADGSPQDLVAQSRTSATYVVQVRRHMPGDDERAKKIWQNLPFIADVQPDTPERSSLVGGWSLWLLTTKPGAPDLREAIATAASTAGILVRELRREEMSLEKVFLRIVEGEDKQGELAAAAVESAA